MFETLTRFLRANFGRARFVGQHQPARRDPSDFAWHRFRFDDRCRRNRRRVAWLDRSGRGTEHDPYPRHPWDNGSF